MDKLDVSSLETSVHVKTRKGTIDFDRLCDYSINLGKAYSSLHSRGLCYQDVNKDNMYFHPDTRKVFILDIDNITVSNKNALGEVVGTPGFIAPEIFSGKSSPNATTDKFSLAVMLFNMWESFEPFEGRYYYDNEINFLADPNFSDSFYSNPLFIFHPTEMKNSVKKEPKEAKGIYGWVNYNWLCTPDTIKDAFIQTFVDSINDTSKRLTMSAWKRILKDVKASLVQCPKCGKYMTHESIAIEGTCIHCDKKVKNYSKPINTTPVRTLGATQKAVDSMNQEGAKSTASVISGGSKRRLEKGPLASVSHASQSSNTTQAQAKRRNSIVVFESGVESKVLGITLGSSFSGADVSSRLAKLPEVFDLIPHIKDNKRIAIRNKSGYNWDVYISNDKIIELPKGKSVGLDKIAFIKLPGDIKLRIDL